MYTTSFIYILIEEGRGVSEQKTNYKLRTASGALCIFPEDFLGAMREARKKMEFPLGLSNISISGGRTGYREEKCSQFFSFRLPGGHANGKKLFYNQSSFDHFFF